LLACLAPSTGHAAHLSAVRGIIKQTEAAHPNALWHIVHGVCVRDMRLSGLPAPCAEVNLAGGYAVWKDIEQNTQYLLVPTRRITGIESPILQAPSTPNYWQAAWTARRFIDGQEGADIPREDIGLAVNSIYGRTQSQLHIHIDCVKPNVRRLLQSHEAEIGSRWSSLAIQQRRYRVRWISGSDLGDTDPFKLLARTDRTARRDMGSQTLVLIGASRSNGRPGFYMLSDRADPGLDDDAAGEEVLDHHCSILSQAAR